MQTRKGTLSDAVALVSTMDIVEAFDVPYQARRGKTYLICPGHEDQHFGSCYIDKRDNGYYCYVCKEYVDKWNMVLKLNGGNKAAARDWFFQTAGISPVEIKVDDPYKNAKALIRRLEPYLKNGAVHNDLSACDKMDSSYNRNINGEYLYSELMIQNPLAEIYKNDKNAFKRIVINVLRARECEVTSKMHDYENEYDFLYVDGVGVILYTEIKEACMAAKQAIARLIEEVEQL